ncbi:MAG: phosphoribosylamine--glycine ligase [Kiritimatiellaeota bacterium]|nr:phosphoribosylamine--glycine ligase [Kiritimatiellota bacterium]
MKALVVGGGGREHALVWALDRSPSLEAVYCAPGNDGMRQAECVPFEGPEQIAAFAEQAGVDLTVVGPEAPLCAGIVDVFRDRGLRIIGPTAAAARLEASKSFAKDFMLRYGIPTARAEVFTDEGQALECLRRRPVPIVVKADGLAAGKGVIVAATREEAASAVRACFAGRFGEAGRKVLVEDCLVGEEASIIALTDGRTIVPLATSQDHKRIGDGDTGPNTGGMGAYSPTPAVPPALMDRIRSDILDRFLAGCCAENLDYRGVIYAGIMITDRGPQVLEFNVRLGDPETQAILPRLDTDLGVALIAAADRRLDEVDIRWSPQPAVCVVMASKGYPGTYAKGEVIQGIEEAERHGAVVFHAGTRRDGSGRIVTDGGRVLGVTALGDDLPSAVKNVYRAVRCIHWPGAFYRRDIAAKALRRLSGADPS